MSHTLGLRSIVLAVVGLALTLGDLRAEKPLTSYPQAAQDRFNQGEELREKAKYNEAAAAYDEAIKLGLDTYSRVYLRKADCCKQLGEFARTVESYTRLIDDLGLERSCWICMISALRGRSAAFVKLGDLERAQADLTMVVLLYEQNLSLHQELKAGELTDLVKETAKAHQDRRRILLDRENWKAGQADLERAEQLERLIALKPTAQPTGWIRLVNQWSQRVTVEVDGEVHELQPGQEKKWRRAAGAFKYTVREVGFPVTSSVEDGKMTTLRIYPPRR